MEEYNEWEMARMRKLIIFCVALMMMISMPTALAAITVDGYKSANEWDESWSLGQDHATTYSADGPFGDRLVIRQGGYEYPLVVTDTWYNTDPKDDSGGDFDVSMATLGDSSGFDIANVYAHYDPFTDTVYGLTEVYGIPGDLDGDGNIGGQIPADKIGDTGPAGTGLGDTEFWNLRMIQGTTYTDINLINNDWSVSGNGLQYGDVEAKFTSDATNSVYEISLTGISNHYSVAPGATLAMQVIAGSSGDSLGEDTAMVFIKVPNPNIRIVKTTSNGQGGWADGPLLTVDDTVTWRYIVTNMGDVPLTDIVVTDNKEGVITFSKNNLDPQESMTAYESGVVFNAPYSNLASVVGYYQNIPFDATDPSSYRIRPPIDVPALTPAGLLGLIGLLGIIGIIGLKRRN